MKLKELRTKAGDLQTKIDGLEKAAEGRAMTDEEYGELRSLSEELSGVLDQIEVAQTVEANRERVETPQEEERDAEHIEVTGDERSERPMSLGELLIEVRSSVVSGMVSERLRIHEHEQRAVLGMSEGIPSDGGFLVGTQESAKFIDRSIASGKLGPLCQTTEVGPGKDGAVWNGFDEPSRADSTTTASYRNAGVRGYWMNEGGAFVASQIKLRRIKVDLEKIGVLYYATSEELEDAVALESRVRPKVTNEFGFLIDDALINGDGAGKPLGLLAAAGTVSVAKETGQSADTVLFENVSKMRIRALDWMNSVWLANIEVSPQLEKMVIVGGTASTPVFIPGGSLANQPEDKLYGRPIIFVEQAAALGDTGDIILANFQGYELIRKGQVKEASSIHVQFLTDQTAFRFIMRINGQPSLDSAIAPYKGNVSKTDFVILAARA